MARQKGGVRGSKRADVCQFPRARRMLGHLRCTAGPLRFDLPLYVLAMFSRYSRISSSYLGRLIICGVQNRMLSMSTWMAR